MTRRGINIEKWFFLVFSMMQLPMLGGQSASPHHTIFQPPETIKFAFPNLFWGEIQGNKQETFCIFRNYGSGLQGLRDIGLNHITPRWRFQYENKGSNEWNTQLAAVSHRLQMTKNQQVSMGIGGIKSQNQWGGLIHLQFLFMANKSGTFSATYRNVFTAATFQNNSIQQFIAGPPNSSLERSWQYQEKLLQAVWVGHNSSFSAKDPKVKSITPFIQFTHSPQQQFLEVGALKNLGSGINAMIALNSTQQPLRWGIYYNKKSWSGGLEGKWLRPLGMVYGWQLRYRWL